MKIHTPDFSRKSVAIIDSRPMFRRGLMSSVLSIYETSDIQEFSDYKELAEIKSEVIFISGADLSSSEILASIKSLHKNSVHSKIVLYEYRDSLNFLLTCFQESLNGYLSGSFTGNDLEDCMRCLDNNKLYLNNEVAYQMLMSNLKNKPQKKILSGLENKVAEYLLRGMGTTQIANLLDRRPSTISTVKANIFKKTQVKNVVELAKLMV